MNVTTANNRPNMFATTSNVTSAQNNTKDAAVMKDLIDKAAANTDAKVAATTANDRANDMQAHFGGISKPNI